MHIFTYRWPDEELPADNITHLQALIDTRSLVLFQNMPQTETENFPGGVFREIATGSKIGCYAYSPEAGVMDRADWAVFNLNEDPCAQSIGLFGNNIVNIDITADTPDSEIEALKTLLEADEKLVLVFGNFEKDIVLTGFTDVKSEETDKTFAKIKSTVTDAQLVKLSLNEEYLTNTPVCVEFTPA